MRGDMHALLMLQAVQLAAAATTAAMEGQLLLVPAAARKTPAQIAPYPPMQWHSFGEFKEHDEINEANMLGPS